MTDESGEWGPWTRHSGDECPLAVGTVVQVDVGSSATVEGCGQFCTFKVLKCNLTWVGWPEVIRYRIRKPRSKAADLLLERLRDAPREFELAGDDGPVREEETV